MTPKKCMFIAKSLTNTQHMELEPLCALVKADFTALVIFVKSRCYRLENPKR